MCNLWATAVYATALWAIGVAAAIYEPAKRHAGEAWVVTASEKISTRPTLVRAHVPVSTADIRKRSAMMAGPTR
jgi:hypothetical protein